MATKTKRPAKLDIRRDRRRNLLIQIALTTVVVVFAVGLCLYIVLSNEKKAPPPPPANSAADKAIRVVSNKLATQPGNGQPKVVLSMYEDFLCPGCGRFEKNFGKTVNELIDSGAVAADYHMVAILDSPQSQNYSSRAGAAGYCVADESVDAFRRFHSALYSPQIQPSETGTSFPDNTKLIELAREAGAAGSVPACVTSGKYLSTVLGMAAAGRIDSTPTIRLNGQEYSPTTPEALVADVKKAAAKPVSPPAAPPVSPPAAKPVSPPAAPPVSPPAAPPVSPPAAPPVSQRPAS